jgi:hypothetical protein
MKHELNYLLRCIIYKSKHIVLYFKILRIYINSNYIHKNIGGITKSNFWAFLHSFFSYSINLCLLFCFYYFTLSERISIIFLSFSIWLIIFTTIKTNTISFMIKIFSIELAYHFLTTLTSFETVTTYKFIAIGTFIKSIFNVIAYVAYGWFW